MDLTIARKNFPTKIKEVLIDLYYRRNYDPGTRAHIKQLAYAGDLRHLEKLSPID